MKAMRRASLFTPLALALAAGCASSAEPREPGVEATVGGESRARVEREDQAAGDRGMMHDHEMHAGAAQDQRVHGGMAHGEATQRGTTGRDGMGAQAGDDVLASMCPMLTSTTNIAVEDLDQGVALRFTAESPAEVEALRGHVRHMAGMPGWNRPAGAGRGASMPIPAATPTVVDVPGGARLELRARTPQDVDTLRARTRMRAERMRTGECPMMQAAAPRRSGEPG